MNPSTGSDVSAMLIATATDPVDGTYQLQRSEFHLHLKNMKNRRTISERLENLSENDMHFSCVCKLLKPYLMLLLESVVIRLAIPVVVCRNCGGPCYCSSLQPAELRLSKTRVESKQ